MHATRLIRIGGKALAGGALPAVVTPLVGSSPQALLDEVAAIVPKRPDLLEWRVDYFARIGDAEAVVDTAQAIRRAAGEIPLLLTRRHVREGGRPIDVDEERIVAMYAAACRARCVDMIDYELSNARQDLTALRQLSRDNGVAMIMSFHDFNGTPPDAVLDEKFAEAERLGADVAKVAVTPQNEMDVLALLAATRRASETLALPIVSMSMGNVGSLSRIIGWVYGSAATFAVGQRSSAPGQIAIDDLRAALAIVQRAVGGTWDPPAE